MLKRLYFGVLVHIKNSQQELELTEICGPSPPGTGTKNPSNHKNAMADLGGHSRVEKSLFRCISAYKDLRKRVGTHRVISSSSSWYPSGTCNKNLPKHMNSSVAIEVK